VVGRWVARVFGGLVVLGVVSVFIWAAWKNGGLGGFAPPLIDEKLALLGFGLMLAGLAAAWIWEGVGGALTLGAYAFSAIRFGSTLGWSLMARGRA
jgi:hypothetical protein